MNMTSVYAKGRKYKVLAELDDAYTITIKKGGTIAIEHGNSLSGKVKKLRENPDYVDENGTLIKDIHFKSVSTAACFVTGTMSNGFKVWRNKKDGALIQRK